MNGIEEGTGNEKEHGFITKQKQFGGIKSWYTDIAGYRHQNRIWNVRREI